MQEQDLFLSTLREPKDAIFATASRELRNRLPGKAILETDNPYFDPQTDRGAWCLRLHPEPANWALVNFDWKVKAQTSHESFHSGWCQATWDGHAISLFLVKVSGEPCDRSRWFIIADTPEIGRGFFDCVCAHHSVICQQVLIFEEGHWRADRDLFEAISQSKLEDLTLHSDLKDQITFDISAFFDQESLYTECRIPWKRGILFLGPPGNGKTHLIRALMSHFDKPCLYVKSFSSHYMSPQMCVSRAFDRAREVTPCFLILEDLDTLLTDKTRSFFLNEMDGFASNHGIITIATCNFPERLDPAILERPSRFDRKYHFNLPEEVDRRNYLSTFMLRFGSSLQLDDCELDQVAAATAGYSYAYLKELYVASVVRWVSTDQHRKIADVLSEQAEVLRQQMTTDWAEAESKPRSDSLSEFGNDDDDDDED